MSTVSVSVPEKAAGRSTRRQRAAWRKRSRPETLLRRTRLGSQPRRRERKAGSVAARGRDQTTTRAVCPVSREPTWTPRMRSVRSTFIAAGSLTSTSVSSVTSSKARNRLGPPAESSCETTSTRVPDSSSWWPQPLSFRESSSFSSPASTAFSRPPATAKIRPPADLTMSGSSTPASWTFVPESSCTASPSSCERGAGRGGPGPPGGSRSGGMKVRSSATGTGGPAPGPRGAKRRP